MASLFGFDLTGIVSAITGWLGPFGKVLDQLKLAYEHISGLWDASVKLKDSILGEIDGWKTFKQDIRIKQRVIQLERAIEKTRDLVEGIPESWNAIKDIISQVKDKIKEGGGGNPVAEAEEAATDLESGGAIKTLLQKFPKLAKGLEKLLGALAIIVEALDGLRNVVDDLQTIVDELKALRLEFEKLDTVFLSQSNKRKTLRLEDGSTIRVRLGKLHS